MKKLNSVFFFVTLVFLPNLAYSEAKIDFARDIQPILSDMCFHCHGPDSKNREADLRLDTFAGATEKRKHGAAIVPGQAMKSEMFLRMLTDDEDDVMPPADSNRHVSAEQKDLIKRWINQGAQWAEHWAFVKPKSVQVPNIGQIWANNPIDHFVFQKQEQMGLKPNPEAEKETLLRRLSLDLTGLAATPADIKSFVEDASENAYEKQVTRLLNSEHYGERMAWPWLDAARYADTNGYQGDRTRTMWPWRDWVIKAFNDNMPFDQFAIEQIAGDLLPKASMNQKLATAFLRNHMINGEGGRIPEENRVEYVFDQMETVGTTFLGLTMYCCRCHDHKYDPISQKDYFSLFAFFNQTPVKGDEKGGVAGPHINLPIEKSQYHQKKKALKEKEQKLIAMEAKLRSEFQASSEDTSVEDSENEFVQSNVDYKKLKKSISDHKNKMYHKVMVMQDNQNRKTHILNAGLYNQKKAEVQADTPSTLPPMPKGVEKNRLSLAQWIVSKDNPLTARVIINRLWAQVFGEGLTKTTENLGVQGERPTHPELLDWLALEFMNSGWNVKHMMKLMVTSATYKQAATFNKEKLDMDPDNRFLARGSRYRLPSWMIRDQALASSGLLNAKMGGAGVRPYQPSGVWAEMTFGKIKYQEDQGDKLYRRSIYTFWRRIVAPTMFFDIANRQICEVESKLTNTPLHALVTMNDITYIEAGRGLAKRAISEKSLDEKINHMFMHVLGRPAKTEEMKILKDRYQAFLGQYQNSPELAAEYLSVGELKMNPEHNAIELAALSSIGLLVLNLDESLTRE